MNPIKFQEQVFFLTSRISISTDEGSSIGTGFLYRVSANPEKTLEAMFLISNKHVFKNPKGAITISFNKKKDDGSVDLGNIKQFSSLDFSSIYTEHPDPEIDLACINVSMVGAPEHNVFYKSIFNEMVSSLNEPELVPGSEVWFVGYPENRFDVKNNLPILRKGFLASLPKVDFNNKKEFVIDAQVFQGSSGSPVFTIINNDARLIGVVSQTMIKHGKLQSLPSLTVEDALVQQILGLGIVIKSTMLKEMLDLAIQKAITNDKK